MKRIYSKLFHVDSAGEYFYMTEQELMNKLDSLDSFRHLCLPVYDLESGKVEGKRVLSSSNASYKNRAIYLLAELLKGYELYFPVYKDEEISLLSIKDEERRIYHFSFDSENERAVWKLSELCGKDYEIVLVREKGRIEYTNLSSISISELFAPLNF